MADTTPIEWCDATWSPWEGCTKVSPGCDGCYAEAMNKWLRKGENWGSGAPRREYSEEHWRKPIAWNAKAQAAGKRLRVFPSVCDPFDNEVEPAWRARFFALIAQTPHLTWLLLTKRIGNVAKMLEAPGMQKCGMPANVWLGATVVNQEEALRDITKLVGTPARVHFISYEPALGPLDLDVEYFTALHGSYPFKGVSLEHRTKLVDMLDWVIAGGESGHGARPAHPDWFRSLRDQCAAAGVPFLFKQWGEWASIWHARLDPAVAEGKPFVHVTPMCRLNGTNGSAPNYELSRVGKKAAGRLLDGVEHNGFPDDSALATRQPSTS